MANLHIWRLLIEKKKKHTSHGLLCYDAMFCVKTSGLTRDNHFFKLCDIPTKAVMKFIIISIACIWTSVKGGIFLG
jgi:hypothetical protein